jgi:NTP pyrophosphatase (non-canonical NTP hydrolase)
VTAPDSQDVTLTDRWERKAEENVEEWGQQNIETLLLAIQEELGELTQATLEYRAEDGVYAPLFEELDDMGALLIQLHGAIDGHRFDVEPWGEDDAE